MLWCGDGEAETTVAPPDAVTKVTNESLLISDIDRVKSLQAALFPVYNKGTYLASFLSNTIKSNQLEINTDNKTFRTFAKLKEPRELFALPKELDCPQQAARWPTECQVLDEHIQHIEYSPPFPEPYYTPSGRELRPQPVGEDSGTVTFQYYPMSAVNYFSRSTVGGSRLFLSACSTGGDNDDLRFESRFECGNLAKAVRITATYYELHLRTDLYTNRHMQWFYFRVSNTRKHIMYRFSIVNLTKPESLYNEGMMPLLYSTRDAQLHSIGWRRCGENICYFKNDPTCDEEEQFPNYTLTFNIEFPHDGDDVYLAHCYPYSYTDLQDYLAKLQNHPVKSTFTKLRLLCRTLAGNNVYYLTITAPSEENESRKKKAIVITARVHPGETPSSWMMKGFLDFLTGDSSQARELREKFIFKLVPMLNPDGVIVGNNRCSLTGKDLNRQYRTVIRETYPSVWHTKLMIRRLMEECGVVMYCDLHAHSRKHNIFIYGCENRRGADKRLHEQVFPLMMHKNSADKFSFENCKFRIQRSKEGTGRVVIWMMGVANSYTMEASFGGSELGGRTSTHFSSQDFESLGRTFCETLLDFYDEEPSKERLRNKIITRLLKEGSSADEPTNIDLSDYSSDEGDTSSSSSEGAGECTFQPGAGGLEPPPALLAPPPSPVQPDNIQHRRADKFSRRCQTKPEIIKYSQINQRETLQICRATIDMPSDAYTDMSSDLESADEGSPIRMVKKLFRPPASAKPRRRKKMPPELKVRPAQVYESPDNSDKERSLKPMQRPRSVSFNEPNHMKMMMWHQFRCFPPPKSLSELRNNRQNQPTELEVKLTTLKRGVWSGVQGDGANQGPLSWGVSSFAMNSYFTDSEALLRSCSKKLEALEGHNNNKEEKPKKKNKTKKKEIVKSSHFEDGTDRIENIMAKPWKKKNKFKLEKIKDSPTYTHSSSFTEVPQPNVPQIITRITNDQNKSKAKTRFRKSGYVATAIQTKKTKSKSKTHYTDNSDTDNSSDYKGKTKRMTKNGKERRQSQTKISGRKKKG